MKINALLCDNFIRGMFSQTRIKEFGRDDYGVWFKSVLNHQIYNIVNVKGEHVMCKAFCKTEVFRTNSTAELIKHIQQNF